MRTRAVALAAMTAAMALTLVSLAATPANADAAKPGTSMTHIKTTAGLASSLEGAGVVLYTQGGATSAVIGESLAAANSQVVFHVPVTGTKSGVQHLGSVLVVYNTSNNQQVQLQNPVINLTQGVVTATVPQAGGQSIPVFTISNAAALKPVVKTDRKARIRTTTYAGAQLVIAPGVGAVLNSTLGLPAGTIADGSSFATAEVTLNSVLPAN